MFRYSTYRPSSLKHLSYICQQTSDCLMQRTMLAAVHSTKERLIAPW